MKNIIQFSRSLVISFVLIMGLVSIIASCGGGGDDNSNTGTIYQYSYDGSGTLASLTKGGDCDCDFEDGGCNLKYNGLGQLIEACIIGHRPVPCAKTHYDYDNVGRMSELNYTGSCNCSGYTGGPGQQTYCDIKYDVVNRPLEACVCGESEIPINDPNNDENALTIFSDRGVWETAAGGTPDITEDFNSFHDRLN